jgi:hypothetical protein
MDRVKTCPKVRHRRALGLVALFAMAGSAPGEPARHPATRPVPEILRTLHPGHPRLLVTDEDVRGARQLARSDPEAGRLLDEIRELAVRILDDKPVTHRLIGPRLLDQSRACLGRVATWAAMYRLEGDRRFAERAEREMLTAAAFPDWNPSHFLDTAEMSNALAIGYDWLYDALKPESRRLIRIALVEKGLRPGLAIYRKHGGWSTARHNWNQVCNGGMTVAALAIADEEPALAAEVIESARASIPLAMRTLAPDGGWPEGPGYWGYAMRYTAYYRAAMQTALGTDFGLSTSPGFADTGRFRIHFIGPTRQVFNFADGSSGLGDAAEMMYFARMFDRPAYAAHQREYRRAADVFNLLWADPRGSRDDLRQMPLDARFRGIDVAFMRSAWLDPEAWFVGFKGGDNAANHSHLDLGDFVLDAMGERWAMELGADDYNLPGYWGEKRWTYYRLRTEGQNTLVLNGENQATKAKAPIIAFASSPERAFAIADLSAGYARQARRVQRGIALLDRRAVLVQDEIEADQPVDIAWGMHTSANIEPDGRRAKLSLDGKTLFAHILEPPGAAWTSAEVTIDPPQRPLKNTRKLALRMKSPGTTRLAILFTAEATSTDRQQPLAPLAEWAKRP